MEKLLALWVLSQVSGVAVGKLGLGREKNVHMYSAMVVRENKES